MNRILRVLMVVLCFEMGALLLYLPWTTFWEQNYFLLHFPALYRFLLNPAFRGAVSGIGVLDILLAFNLIRSRAGASPDASQVAPPPNTRVAPR